MLTFEKMEEILQIDLMAQINILDWSYIAQLVLPKGLVHAIAQ